MSLTKETYTIINLIKKIIKEHNKVWQDISFNCGNRYHTQAGYNLF